MPLWGVPPAENDLALFADWHWQTLQDFFGGLSMVHTIQKRLHPVCSRFLMGIENIGPVPLPGKWGAGGCRAIFPGRKS